MTITRRNFSIASILAALALPLLYFSLPRTSSRLESGLTRLKSFGSADFGKSLIAENGEQFLDLSVLGEDIETISQADEQSVRTFVTSRIESSFGDDRWLLVDDWMISEYEAQLHAYAFVAGTKPLGP